MKNLFDVYERDPQSNVENGSKQEANLVSENFAAAQQPILKDKCLERDRQDHFSDEEDLNSDRCLETCWHDVPSATQRCLVACWQNCSSTCRQ